MYHYTEKGKKKKLVDTLYKQIKDEQKIVIVCVGTDRSTGDSLGPLVGQRLKHEILEHTYVYGDLENPVHALNIKDVVQEVNRYHQDAFVIAVDASLGQRKNIGKVYIKEEPLLPGSAVKKKLPPIGDVHIGGIVNMIGFMEMAVLQNTRLYEVMCLADYISDIIVEAIEQRSTVKRIAKKQNIFSLTFAKMFHNQENKRFTL